MPEETKVETLEQPNHPNQTVARNDVELGLTNWKVLKGPNKNQKYLAPPVTVSNLEDVIKWLSPAQVAEALQTMLKKAFQEIFFDESLRDPATGTFNWAKFLDDAANFTAVSMKMKQILEKLEEEQAELLALIDQMTDTEAPSDELKTAIKQKKADIQSLLLMKEARSRKKTEVEAEAAVAS